MNCKYIYIVLTCVKVMLLQIFPALFLKINVTYGVFIPCDIEM